MIVPFSILIHRESHNLFKSNNDANGKRQNRCSYIKKQLGNMFVKIKNSSYAMLVYFNFLSTRKMIHLFI